MSLSYAKAAGYHISDHPTDRPSLILGNGALVMASGTVQTFVRLPKKAASSTSDANISTEFVILDGFPVDVAMGSRFLKEHAEICEHNSIGSQILYPEISRLLATLNKDEKTGLGKTIPALSTPRRCSQETKG